MSVGGLAVQRHTRVHRGQASTLISVALCRVDSDGVPCSPMKHFDEGAAVASPRLGNVPLNQDINPTALARRVSLLACPWRHFRYFQTRYPACPPTEIIVIVPSRLF